MKRFILLISLLAAATAHAADPKIELAPFPVGRYDHQDRVVACNLALRTSLERDGAESHLSNADYLEQRCGLRGALAVAEAEACAAWRQDDAAADCAAWLKEFRAIRGNANKLKKGRR